MLVRRGIYHAWRPSLEKGVVHHAVIDFDNVFNVLRPGWPVVFEITTAGLQVRLLGANERWTLQMIADQSGALRRIELLWRSPQRHTYDWLFNNCEHVARFVVTGKFRSEQVRTAVTVGVSLGLLAWMLKAGNVAA